MNTAVGARGTDSARSDLDHRSHSPVCISPLLLRECRLLEHELIRSFTRVVPEIVRRKPVLTIKDDAYVSIPPKVRSSRCKPPSIYAALARSLPPEGSSPNELHHVPLVDLHPHHSIGSRTGCCDVLEGRANLELGSRSR